MTEPVSYITTPPHWCPNATPTKRGWVNPVNGELLVGTRFIDPALYGKPSIAQVEPQVEVVEVVETNEAVDKPAVVEDEPVKKSKKSLLDKIKGSVQK